MDAKEAVILSHGFFLFGPTGLEVDFPVEDFYSPGFFLALRICIRDSGVTGWVTIALLGEGYVFTDGACAREGDIEDDGLLNGFSVLPAMQRGVLLLGSTTGCLS